MKNTNYKKNTMGKFVTDFMDKKTYKRVTTRKTRREGKKVSNGVE